MFLPFLNPLRAILPQCPQKGPQVSDANNPVLIEMIGLLTPRAQGRLQGSAKLVVEDQGSVMLDETGARAGDGPADVTLAASESTFRKLLAGDLNPVMAVMTRKLKVDGTPTRALKVSDILLG